jgi:L-Ala-D/L-Glu epimerase
MKLSWEPLTLSLRRTFRIAHGASDQRHNVLLRIDERIGEAAAVPYHGESQAGIMAYLARLKPEDWGDDPALLEDILAQLPSGSLAARAAVDMALHDAWGQCLGQPLYRLFGLNPTRIPPTSVTVAMDEPQAMAAWVRDSDWPIIKVKLGGADDEAILATIREATRGETKPRVLRVDVNGGWSRERAAALLPRLAHYDLELVEQPLPVEDIAGLQWLRAQNLGVPIFADESIKSARDVVAHAGAVDGVVIKLMKSGGIRAAMRAITVARALDMRVMLSCMVESTIAVTAAAHLAPLCDFIDLDGPLLIDTAALPRTQQVQGMRYRGARLILPNRPGLGLTKSTEV